jgi:hypothetical protein
MASIPEKYQKFRQTHLVFQYFTLLAVAWQALLWGGSMLAVAWGIRFIVGEWPTWVNWTAILIAVFVAGYYTWRTDHVRLIPGIKVIGVRVHYQMAKDPNSVFPAALLIGSRYSFVQMLLRCTSDAPLYECGAYLLRVRDWSFARSEWNDVPLGGPLSLKFNSARGSTQHPGAEEPLNVFGIEPKTGRIFPCTDQPTADDNFGNCLSAQRALRLNIRITCSARNGGVYPASSP